MKKKHYIITAVISYFVLLIATIPARPITELINKSTDIQISGVSGSLWNGSAYSIDILGYAELEKTQWSFIPWRLLLGQAAITLDSHYLNNKISTQASISITGRLHINNLSASIPAKQIVEIANIPLVQLDGMLNMDIENAQWQQGELPIATGAITWNNAIVRIADVANLGNVSIILSESEQDTLTANITNKGGEININGTAELIPQEDYAVDLKFTPTRTTKNSLKQSLGMFAKKQANGDFLLRSTGPISQIGF